MIRQFLKQLPIGNNFPIINPERTDGWEAIFNSFSVTGIADGAFINTNWPDTSGHSRNAIPYLGFTGRYRLNQTPNGAPAVDFNAGRIMVFGMPNPALQCDNGFTMLLVFRQDIIDADDQIPFHQDILGGWQTLSVNHASGGPANPSSSVGLNGFNLDGWQTLTPITTGWHTLLAICDPPRGASGACRLFYDGRQVSNGTSWNVTLDTEAFMGNGGGPFQFDGEIAWAGVRSKTSSPYEASGFLHYIKSTFGIG